MVGTRILVTGGAGFIGSHLADALMAMGAEVTVLDDLSVGKTSNLERHIGQARFAFVKDSILNTVALERLVRQADLIYHLAAVVGVKYVLDDPLGAIITNIRGTENVLEMANRYRVRTVIASSSEVYGKSTAMPLRENDDRVLGPTTVNRWSYSASKAIDEYVALAYARNGLPVSIVRYFNVYGPRMDPRGYGSVIARFIAQARRGDPITVYDDGKQTRCFTYVADAVEGTICASKPEATGKIFNIGNEQEHSVNQLALLIYRLTESESVIKHVSSTAVYDENFEETRRRVPNTARARVMLGFEARVSLEEGLRRTMGI